MPRKAKTPIILNKIQGDSKNLTKKSPKDPNNNKNIIYNNKNNVIYNNNKFNNSDKSSNKPIRKLSTSSSYYNNRNLKVSKIGNVTVEAISNNRNDVASKVSGNFVLKSIKLPEPCTTCGRPDQPERFHSHPVTPLLHKNYSKNNREFIVKVPVKNSVQKPVAIKFKSKQQQQEVVQFKRPTFNDTAKKFENLNEKVPEKVEKVGSAGKGPRMLICYICGREFGTASLPLHEPKCLQKWERENASLPRELRRKAPIKPEKQLSQEEWNKLAWEASQATLTPCNNCGRTFYPDRLIVHQRSCKPTNMSRSSTGNFPPSSFDSGPDVVKYPGGLPTTKNKPGVEKDDNFIDTSTPTSPGAHPPAVYCKVCGKMFGTKSIKIHEPQCLKKWHQRNDNLAPKDREPLAGSHIVEGTNESSPKGAKTQNADSNVPRAFASVEENNGTAKKSPLFPCYLCGQLFTVHSIYQHEPICLKKWRAENDKLPPNKRRKEPTKPDVKFTPSGGVDFKGTFNRIWENHLSELEECPRCHRKFFPDRIETHIASCAGTKVVLKGKNKPIKNK